MRTTTATTRSRRATTNAGAIMTMSTMSTQTITVNFEEDGDNTRAIAVLRIADRELRGMGEAHRNPVDKPRPTIGEETAAARALVDLAHRLLDTAGDEIEVNVRQGDPDA
jgi:hypothetical protein